MKKIHIKCKQCNEVFNVDVPSEVGIYRTKCPHCNSLMTFKVFPPFTPSGQTIAPKKAITIKCPHCETMFSAPIPSAPGCYGIACPSCKREIKVKFNQ